MKELLKMIRESVRYSQIQMSKELNVSFATINRWENGHAIPNKLAQEKIYEFSKNHSVNLYDLIIKNIINVSSNINLDDNRMILYHASKSGIKGKIAPISRDKCDFGKGFYMGTLPEQPLTLICDFEDSRFYIVSIDKSNLNSIEIPTNIDWAMIIAFNRGRMNNIKNTKLYDKYDNYLKNNDLAIGYIADDRMFNVIDNFFEGYITDLALINSLSALELGKQYVMLTQRGCDNVKIEKEIELSWLERKCLKEVSEENRSKEVNFVNEICKNYRREGRFFDEILSDRLKGEE